jgi:hypothetical protein
VDTGQLERIETMNDATQVIAKLSAPVARMLAVEILLADPEALHDDVLESCLYLLREKLRSGIVA